MEPDLTTSGISCFPNHCRQVHSFGYLQMRVDHDFNGKLEVSNRFLYSNLNLSKYSFELVKFGNIFPKVETVKKPGTIKSPDIGVGELGILNLELPGDWKSYDVLYVTAVDQYSRHINTWSWKIVKPQDFSSRVVNSSFISPVTASDPNNQLTVSSGKTAITFDKLSGSITLVKSDGKRIPFGGFQFTGFNRTFKEMKNYAKGEDYIVEILYDSACYATWTMMKGGWLKLDYGYSVKGLLDYAGITFTYPENLVTGATLMANGPYRVWKNRSKVWYHLSHQVIYLFYTVLVLSALSFQVLRQRVLRVRKIVIMVNF